MGTPPPPTANDPVWTSDGTVPDVSKFFSDPYFVGQGDPASVGAAWIKCMKENTGIDLSNPDQVWGSGNEIYNRLIATDLSQMPPGSPWPPDIIEQFRIWYDQGGRKVKTEGYPGSYGTPSPLIPAPNPTRAVVIPQKPVWTASDPTVDDVSMLFTNPCWIQNGGGVAAGWRMRMLQFQYDALKGTFFDIQEYAHVSTKAEEIYYHMVSQSMPPYEPFFSPEACEMVRLWYNAGCPNTPADEPTPRKAADLIPPPQSNIPGGLLPKKPFETRQDINTLTTQQLTAYREALLNAGALELDSTWQTGGFLHSNWCLHYMQASFPWHRAHLLWLEQQLGVPIPYWNFFSSKATDSTSADSGIPQAFLDVDFVGSDGQTKPNPLLSALPRNGLSRNGTSKTVQRAPQLTGDSETRATYISNWTPKYLDQIYKAKQNSNIVGAGPNAWVLDVTKLNDLQTENQAQKDQYNQEIYALGQSDFDGLLELAHDNLHGWTGVDMANNGYAAFDPLFWSYHANFDRIFEDWISANSTSDPPQWGATPLRPFFLSSGGNVTVNEGAESGFTTTIDMVQPAKSLGYVYDTPGNPDYVGPSPSPGASLARVPTVAFPDTKCTDKTYFIHVGIDTGDGKPLTETDPGYIGSVTRLGMGPDNGNNRCIQNGIVRKLDASEAAAAVGGIKEGSELKLKMLVREDIPDTVDNKEVPESEYRQWPGFNPVVVWGPLAGDSIVT
jgi:Common central domain of tyrosinase